MLGMMFNAAYTTMTKAARIFDLMAITLDCVSLL